MGKQFSRRQFIFRHFHPYPLCIWNMNDEIWIMKYQKKAKNLQSIPWWTDPLPIKQSKNVPRNSASQIRMSSFWVRTHLLSFSSKLTNLSDILIGRSINRNVETNQKINLRHNTTVYIANKLLWFNYRHFLFNSCVEFLRVIVAWIFGYF